ncbi:MAG: bifunctional demethylmenaquinone methyltransferase/2-methoxy-6-polyprenyl-1,4-benzoquinol methylase UbiE, partial [Thermoanaerobaculia bacterium]
VAELLGFLVAKLSVAKLPPANCYDASVPHPETTQHRDRETAQDPATPQPGNLATKEPSNPATRYTGPDPDRIRAMFGSIAGCYDRANTVMSAGVHHLWRRKAVRWSGAKAGDAVLDCATGTGDLAIAFKKAVGSGRVAGTDFTPEMIELARTKSRDIIFDVADVTALPFDDDTFDIASIAFGIRNVGDPVKGLAEMARVVRPGGRVIVLEFGQPSNRVTSILYDTYRRHFLPRLGGAVTGERGAYEYLESSAARFPCGEDFVSMMKSAAAFSSVDFRPLTLGIAYLYRAVKESLIRR